jgi:WD40 repeat protein
VTVSGDGTVRIWNAQSGDPLLTLNHDAPVQGAQWNGDESHILTYSDDGTARVWDAQSGELLLTLNGDGSAVTVARWNQDESRILLATRGGLVRAYYTDLTELLEVACQEAATRNLTWSEWQAYFPGQSYRQTCPDLPPHPSVPES